MGGGSLPPRRVRIVVADDHPIVRASLRAILLTQRDFDVVGEAEDGQAAVELAERLRPDVVLMDVRMPRMDGIEATQRITGSTPEVVVVGLSMEQSVRVREAMLRAGAVTFITKDCDPGGIAEAVRRACTAHAAYPRHAR